MILKSVQPIKREECVLRVYVIKGIDLQPKDSNGKVISCFADLKIRLNFFHKIFGYFIQSDPYIQILVGKQKIDNRDEYIPKTINPVFGK